jgi:NADH-quinone oxidoreductase subunit M
VSTVFARNAKSITSGSRWRRHVDFLVSLLLAARCSAAGRSFVSKRTFTWIGSIGARYHLGVDGISLWLVLLTTSADADRDAFELDRDSQTQLSYYVFLLISSRR